MSYIVFDENDQPMRIAARREEAVAICSLRAGWWFKFMRAKKAPKYKFEDALMQGFAIIVALQQMTY